MRLTRRQLSDALIRLPDTKLVEYCKISSTYKVPVMTLIDVFDIDSIPATDTVKELTFEYDPKLRDWVLKDLTL